MVTGVPIKIYTGFFTGSCGADFFSSSSSSVSLSDVAGFTAGFFIAAATFSIAISRRTLSYQMTESNQASADAGR